MRALALVGLLGVLALDGGCAPPLSDTGFRGSWQRSTGDKAARVSIWDDEAGWHFCWSTASAGGGPAFTCTEDGSTVMTERGASTYRYDVRMTPGEGGTDARVEIRGEPLLEGLTPIRWTDRLELEPDGLTILSWRVSLNGRELERPAQPLRLVKISNEPR